jgi:hypothetical protein
MDASNEKLIGILALQSPPLDFPVRDRLFDYAPGRKLGLPRQLLRHGIKREAFLFPLIGNLQAYFTLKGVAPGYAQCCSDRWSE